MALESVSNTAPQTDDGPTADSPHRILAPLVRELIVAMRAGGLSELELEHQGLRLVLKSQPGGATRTISHEPGETASTIEEQDATPDESIHVITAPMVGTFYSAPSPGEQPYVQPGDSVAEGQTIAIIEAMKIMNEIASDRSGEVSEVLAENGQTVEYGSPLVRLRVSQ